MALLDDIASRLEGQGVAGGATGWNLHKSYLPATPDQTVALFETGGETPDQTDGTSYDVVTFQVRVRGKKLEYDVARTKMAAVFSALNGATVSGYVFIFAVQSGPLPMGNDSSERPHLAWNFRAMRTRD